MIGSFLFSNEWIQSMSTLKNAILSKNVQALEDLLATQSQVNTVQYKHSRVPDVSHWTDILLLDWEEGACLLVKYQGHLNDSDKILLAIRNGAVNTLKVFWDHLEQEGRLSYTDQFVEKIYRSVFAGMGQIYNQKFECRDMFPIIDALVERGVNLSGYIAGEYEWRDFRVEGHSLWTRASTARKIEYMKAFWPSPDNDIWKSWPRFNETVFLFIHNTVDYVFRENPEYKEIYKEMCLNILEDFGDIWIKQVAQEPDPDLYRYYATDTEIKKENTQFEEIASSVLVSIDRGSLSQTPSILEFLCAPVGGQVSEWVRLPLLFSQDERKIIWPLWDALQKHDPRGTFVHNLAMDPCADTYNVLKLMWKEYPEFFKNHWFTPDKDGFTAEQKWKELDGQDFMS